MKPLKLSLITLLFSSLPTLLSASAHEEEKSEPVSAQPTLRSLVEIARWRHPELASKFEASIEEAEKKGIDTSSDQRIITTVGRFLLTNFSLESKFHDILKLGTAIANEPKNTSILDDDITGHGIVTRSPGLSHGQIDGLTQLCLEHIYTLAGEEGEPLQVADVGAGHGHFSWKALVAGQERERENGKKGRGISLTMIEQQRSLTRNAANQPGTGPLFKYALIAKPFLKEGVDVKKVSRVFEKDALEVFDMKGAEKRFDLTFSGNLIHCFHPKGAEEYVQKLFNVTKPGGHAYASVHCNMHFSNLRNPDAFFNMYLQQCREGKEFPGYGVLNALTIFDKDAYVSQEGLTANMYYEACYPLDEITSPLSTIIKYPAYYDPKTGKPTNTFHKKSDEGTLQFQHRAVMMYDPKTFKDLFERNGFKVLRLFFSDAFSSGYTDLLDQEQDENFGRFKSVEETKKYSRIGLIAQRPIE